MRRASYFVYEKGCAELETQITIARELNYIQKSDEDRLIERLDYIGRMISNLIKKL